MSSEAYHEPTGELSVPARDLHRALTSAYEELQAIDWYQQRIETTPDEELRAVLEHNRDEEIEHACMLLEWLRRNVPKFDAALQTYLFQSGSIVALEEAATGKSAAAAPAGLGIGTLKPQS